MNFQELKLQMQLVQLKIDKAFVEITNIVMCS